MWELREVYAREIGDVHPAEGGDVGDRVFLADEVGARLKVEIEHAVEALGFAEVALGRVGDAFAGEAVEAGGQLWSARLH